MHIDFKTPTTQLVSFQWFDYSELWADSAASDYDLPHIYIDDGQPNVRFPAIPDNEMVYEAYYETDTGDNLQFTVSGVAPPGICTIYFFYHFWSVENIFLLFKVALNMIKKLQLCKSNPAWNNIKNICEYNIDF